MWFNFPGRIKISNDWLSGSWFRFLEEGVLSNRGDIVCQLRRLRFDRLHDGLVRWWRGDRRNDRNGDGLHNLRSRSDLRHLISLHVLYENCRMNPISQFQQLASTINEQLTSYGLGSLIALILILLNHDLPLRVDIENLDGNVLWEGRDEYTAPLDHPENKRGSKRIAEGKTEQSVARSTRNRR
jgi:hypothetical protein